jgi:hypothetical protein
MTETTTATASSDTPQLGLWARVLGVIFSPRQTYAAVAARPRALGVLAVITIVMAIGQFVFLSSQVGQEIALDQQVRSMEAFGMTVTDEMYAGIERGITRARYTSAISLILFIPLFNAIIAGLLLVVFTMLLGGSATFKHVNAIVAHAGVISVLQQLFALPLTYASGEASGANLGVFVPMLDENSLPVLFLGSIDLFYLWWCISLAIGLGVLYRRRTGPIATGLISLYVLIALVIAFIRS